MLDRIGGAAKKMNEWRTDILFYDLCIVAEGYKLFDVEWTIARAFWLRQHHK